MSALMPVPMSHWRGGCLEYIFCTRCSWRYPTNGERPTRELAAVIKAAFDAHDCTAHPPNRPIF